MEKSIEVNKVDLALGLNILEEITGFIPYSSISFQSSEEIISAVQEAERIAAWGMAKNKHKMRKAARQTLQAIADNQPEEPVNLNLSKYEMKSLMELRDLLELVLDDQKDGVHFI